MTIDHLPYRPFAATLGDAILKRDAAAVHALLAPWLQARMEPGALEAELQRHVEQYAAEQWDGADLGDFTEHRAGGNGYSWEELCADDKELAARVPQVTPANFRAWLVLKLRGAGKAPLFVGAVADLWFAVVEVDGQQRVGHYQILDAD